MKFCIKNKAIGVCVGDTNKSKFVFLERIKAVVQESSATESRQIYFRKYREKIAFYKSSRKDRREN